MKRALLSLVVLALMVSARADRLVLKSNFAPMQGVGVSKFVLTVTGSGGKPVTDAQVKLNVEMTTMQMGVAHPTVTNNHDGTYSAEIHPMMAGGWRIVAEVTLAGDETATQTFEFEAEDADEHHHAMQGRLGNWSMSKEGSGTSWIPESSPMNMLMLPASGRYELNAMGSITLQHSNAGGWRGKERTYSNSMFMLMGRRETGGGTLGLNLMMSLDPVFNGEYGYPNLFQTGETAYGHKLTDWQHPHDLFVEASASYSKPISSSMIGFVYAAPVGEPALGGPTFMHRPSGMEIPEAPITHHWFDSTHISWGVVTAGVNTEKWQWEASVFNGHEPNENRFAPDPLRLDASSTRFTFNPDRNWSFNAGYGYLRSPESTEPGVDQHRIAAAALWNHPLGEGKNFAATLGWGRNISNGKNSDAFLLEGTYATPDTSWYARWEHVAKDELGGVPAGNYMINKFLVGGVKSIATRSNLDLGLGAYAGFYVFPKELRPSYGKSPVTLGVYLRLRPGRM